MAKRKNIIARVGNFEITKESGAKHDYIRIKAISGSWGITHRDDSPMYGAWLMMCKDPEYRKGMEVIITMSYHLTNSILDKEFVEDFFNALDAMGKRRVANAPIPTEQEETDAIAEVQMMEEVKKTLTDEKRD
ncbi:hypothetical protein EEL52_13795 [Muribaculaceae bacterium Isolate-113 (HZI)]|uniref:hypothetical protein n=1 Tax=uncultured Muribaculum sp. TaxID=1918613 RepID=UPI000F48F681|nr:hypothetical protein [uncultured Muribaculum sp.]ROT18114.1 hypothetical protein EEL52_13795 [Muribaculaceae bacterium Isolate-113 (HZI)]